MRLFTAATTAICSLLLFACSPADSADSNKVAKPQNQYETAGDIGMGDPKAPVVVLEYASVTCVHCATFHETILPELKEKYIDTGKVRYVMREFPTQPVPIAVAGFLIARCAGDDKYYDVIDALMRAQRTIMSSNSPRAELLKIAQQAGLSEDQFNTCIQDEKGLERIQANIDSGVQTYKISSTPSFVVNGKLVSNVRNFDDLAKVIDPMLK